MWLLFTAGTLALTLGVFRYFGREGLMALIAVYIILCNFQVIKITTMFGFTVTLGNALYAAIFFATDLLSEVWGKKAANRGVVIGFLALVLMTVIMQVSLRYTVIDDPWAIRVQESMTTLFGFMPRVAAASLTAYLLSQFHDVWAYHFLMRKTGGRHLWLRNNVSTMVSQLIDSLVFCFIAFWGVIEGRAFLDILVTTYILKFIVALMDTPFIYLGRRLAPVVLGREGRHGGDPR